MTFRMSKIHGGIAVESL